MVNKDEYIFAYAQNPLDPFLRSFPAHEATGKVV